LENRKPVRTVEPAEELQAMQSASAASAQLVHDPNEDQKRHSVPTPKRMMAAGMSEAEAIERAKQGDGRCFEALYGMHKRRVYSLCLRMTGNTAEAEDLTQEAFLQLYRKIATFRGESAFSTWLHRLAVNVVLMHLRKKGLPEVSLQETLEPAEEDGPKKDIGAQDQVLAGSIDRVNLERAIESLPPGYRIIFVLHDIEGYEHNEIAEMMGCSIGNSKSQLHKARMKLRDLLKITRAERAGIRK
jgi:RNA polymerase sigma-70 factor (ECF subfamily)